MEKSVSKLTIVLISVIIILVGVLIYGVYSGFRVKTMIASMQTQISQLVGEKNNITSQLDILQNKYNLLQQDVAKIYKTCLRDNACKGRFPNVSWYCNNVGDDADYSIASHICICDVRCDLIATPLVQPNNSGY